METRLVTASGDNELRVFEMQFPPEEQVRAASSSPLIVVSSTFLCPARGKAWG